jgi:hypothetical protein
MCNSENGHGHAASNSCYIVVAEIASALRIRALPETIIQVTYVMFQLASCARLDGLGRTTKGLENPLSANRSLRRIDRDRLVKYPAPALIVLA